VSKSKKERVKGTKGVYDSLFIIRMFKSEQDEYGEWAKREKVEIPVQAREYNVGSPSISYDGTKMYFTVCQAINDINICNIYYSESTGAEWGKPVRLKNVNSKIASSKYPYVFFDAEEQKEYLIYSSNVKGGMGKYDIYYASIENDGSVSDPINMGAQINTLDDEVTPFYDPVAGNLYFSSSGHIGIGELDVFKVKGSISEGFEEPENIGYPLNSCADDYYFANTDSTDNGEKLGFLSSNRAGGLSEEGETCCDDIYSFTWRTRPSVLNLGVAGYVYNEETKEPIDDVLVELLLAEYDSLKGSQKISAGQKFFFDLKQDNNYYLKASKNNYVPTKVSVSTYDKVTHDTVQADIYMKEIILPPVYYGFSKKDVMQSSYDALENLINVMKEYPSMAVQISSHTDNVGSDDFNMKLSQKRANAVKNHLITNNVDASRIVEQYYGESAPAAQNAMADGSDNPDGRQQNRRSEFNMLTSVESIIVDKVIRSEDGTTKIMATKIVLPIVYFGFDRFDLTPVAKEKLEEMMAVVSQYPGSIIEVNAHTDSQGSSEYNQNLSKKRAESVMEYFNEKGLRDDVIQGSWEGEENPLKSNESIEGRAKNRRAEFRLMKNGKLLSVSGENIDEEVIEGEDFLEEEEVDKIEELFEEE
jgi:outer membrane protein OmpA-like peptidoglycan-associated protein